MFPYVFYRDVFRRSYQIVTHAGEDIHPSGELMRFNCPVLTQQFLRRIHVLSGTEVRQSATDQQAALDF